MTQRYQNGHIRRAKRTSGPDVWEFLFRELSPDGKRHQRTLTIGTVQQFRTEREALNEISSLRRNINRELRISALLKFGVLVDHYRETELQAENKTQKTREVYLAYLKNWILPAWDENYLHNIKPVAVEQWLRSLKLSNGSKAKIRNIMSAVFSHAIRYELTDKNPITAVRQPAARIKIPVVFEISELHRLFDVLALRERSMIITAALTAIRRSELMGLKWEDIDFMEQKINVVRSVVDCHVGFCKTEASRKHVPINEHIAQVLMKWRQESAYAEAQDWVWASPAKRGRDPYWPQTIMRKHILPAAASAGITKHFGWHTFRHTFSTLIKSLGVDAKVVQELLRHASFKTTMDAYTQALEEPKRLAQERLTNLIMEQPKPSERQQLEDHIMRTGKVGHA